MTKKKEDGSTEAPGKRAWTREQPAPEPRHKPGYRLVSFEKPRRVLAEVPDEVVDFERDDEGHKVLVFDGVRCPKGVVDFHGVPCFVDGEPAESAA